jgi:hypothetical protein
VAQQSFESFFFYMGQEDDLQIFSFLSFSIPLLTSFESDTYLNAFLPLNSWDVPSGSFSALKATFGGTGGT